METPDKVLDYFKSPTGRLLITTIIALGYLQVSDVDILFDTPKDFGFVVIQARLLVQLSLLALCVTTAIEWYLMGDEAWSKRQQKILAVIASVAALVLFEFVVRLAFIQHDFYHYLAATLMEGLIWCCASMVIIGWIGSFFRPRYGLTILLASLIATVSVATYRLTEWQGVESGLVEHYNYHIRENLGGRPCCVNGIDSCVSCYGDGYMRVIRGENLRGATFYGAKLKRTFLDSVDLTYAKFDDGSDLSCSFLTRVTLDSAVWCGAWQCCYFAKGTKLNDCRILSPRLFGSTLTSADLTAQRMKAANLNVSDHLLNCRWSTAVRNEAKRIGFPLVESKPR